MDIAFLIGSGTSITLGLPDTQKITDNIFPIRDVFFSSNSHFYNGKANTNIPEESEYNEIIYKVLYFLIEEIKKSDKYQHRNINYNYEDLFYLASLLKNYSFGSENNVLIFESIKKIKKYLRLLSGNFQFGLLEIFGKVVQYIEDMVRISLLVKPKDYEKLSFFKDAYNDKDIDNIHIFSLNHDIVIEEIFKDNIEYTNGFGKEINGVKYWDRSLFSMQYRVKLYKLHGSISWFYFIPNKENNDILFGDIGSNTDFYSSRNPDGEYQWPRGNPQMLMGTENKIFSYVADRVFSELYFWFQFVLRNIKYLFIIGYGFKDSGINNRIRIFYQVCKDIKITIVDLKDYQEIMPRILGNSECKNNSVYFINDLISNIEWNKLKKIIS